MIYAFGGVSDRGRKPLNQDCASYQLARLDKEHVALVTVCDGMGGLEHGERASASVLRAFAAWFRREIPVLAERRDRMEVARWQWGRLLEQQNLTLCRQAQGGVQMGTAMAAVLLWEDSYLTVNVGDVRGYLLRDRLQQVTVDQSFVAEAVAAGRLTPEEARVHPQRNILLQCVGVNEQVQPVFSEGKTKGNDAWLLCSDGFVHELWDAEMEALLSGKGTGAPGEALQTGLEELLSRARQRGETDDITAIAVRQTGTPLHKKFPEDRNWIQRKLGKDQPQIAQPVPLELLQEVFLGAAAQG